jgi:hypothetical protein
VWKKPLLEWLIKPRKRRILRRILMKKYFFTGLTAMVLAIGLTLAGCESPAAGDAGSNGTNGINGGPGLPGPITTAVTSEGLNRYLAIPQVTTAYVVGDVTVTASGTGLVSIPAEKTLRVIGGELGLADGVVLDATAGTLDLDDDKAAVVGETGDNVVILNSVNPKVIAGDNLILPVAVAAPEDIPSAGRIALVRQTLDTALVTAVTGYSGTAAKTAYIVGDVTLPGASTLDISGKYISFLNTLNTGSVTSLTLGANSLVNGLVAGGTLTLAGLGGATADAANVSVLDVGTYTVSSAVTTVWLEKLNGSTGTLAATGAHTVTFSDDVTFGGNTTFADVVAFTANKSIYVNRGKSVTFKAATSPAANNVVFSAGESGQAEFALESGGTFGWNKDTNGTFTVSVKKLSLEDANAAITVNGAAKLTVTFSGSAGILDATLGTIKAVNGETGSVTLTGATLTSVSGGAVDLSAGKVTLDTPAAHRPSRSSTRVPSP